MTHPLRDKVAVVGIGETRYSKNSGVSDLTLQLQGFKLACDDAGLDPKKIDGIVAMTLGACSEDYMTNFGIPDVRFAARPEMGGASPVASLQLAAAVLDAGICNYVLTIVGRNQRSGQRLGGGMGVAPPQFKVVAEHEMPMGVFIPAQWYAPMARRHMHEYGTTFEQFAAVSVTQRYHASLNDNAMMRDLITVEDHHHSRWVVDPFRLLDCCLETDGVAAVILARADRAKDMRHPPVYVSGVAEGHPESPMSITQRKEMTVFGVTKAAPRAFAMAGVGPKDIDVAGLYDCFTFTVINQLEDIGFCGKGEGGPMVESGATRLGGSLPVNTHGGLLSQGHVQGMNHICEATRQLRGTAGASQVKDAEVALLSGYGDYGDGSVAILRR
ncbi:MAG: thiolase family protein [Chloroflexi bacterium]|nr:MAG: thiolase family protein [Chloroflexota bacterium]